MLGVVLLRRDDFIDGEVSSQLGAKQWLHTRTHAWGWFLITALAQEDLRIVQRVLRRIELLEQTPQSSRRISPCCVRCGTLNQRSFVPVVDLYQLISRWVVRGLDFAETVSKYLLVQRLHCRHLVNERKRRVE